MTSLKIWALVRDLKYSHYEAVSSDVSSNDLTDWIYQIDWI